MPRNPWPEDRLQPCGTLAAYRRHQRRGEPPCHDCRLANRYKNTQVTGYPSGRETRLPDYRETRNGLPPFRPYTYRGLGYDLYTGEL